jgi:UDP-N-acetylglucosamine 2-epimerase (non-hydrolysing)
MKKIAVFTGTRAEYGLLYWLMKGIQQDKDLQLQVIVSAMHLSPEFGSTWETIQADGFEIDAKVEMLLSSDTPVGIVKSMGLGTIGFADALDRLRPDCLVVLGDRFEALAIAQAAMIMRIPIAHIHGGEVTVGAYDDAIRHAITKLSSLHFVAHEDYRRRVVQLGEHPDYVLNVGSLGLENIRRTEKVDLASLSEFLDFDLRKPYFLITYHPVTVAGEDSEKGFNNLLEILRRFSKYKILFTYPNSDNGGRLIVKKINDYIQEFPERIVACPSLGLKRYISAASQAEAVIGNSSSGIIEVPSMGVPTVNIGTRQLGRLSAESVIHCGISEEEICAAIQTALSDEFRSCLSEIENPYGDGETSLHIIKYLKEMKISGPKYFYDLNPET